ncbi:MAG: sigma-70 family RNA polymerase sigma factor [Clostridia bacterium]|nr:sigma-70 family RNA polymerase sigma factor [Clostridia bacterium]
MTDERIIELFFERSETAISELEKKYGKLLYAVSNNVLNDSEDARECVNDTYLATWNAIPPTNPNPLVAFVCKITRNLSLKRHRQNAAKKRNSAYDLSLSEIGDFVSAKENVEAENERKELLAAVEGFLKTLSTENRVIFMRRYWFFDSYADISKRVGISEKNVSVRLVRLRDQLRSYLKEREVII